jgi:hypothetical protein
MKRALVVSGRYCNEPTHAAYGGRVIDFNESAGVIKIISRFGFVIFRMAF